MRLNISADHLVVFVIDNHPVAAFGFVELIKDLSPCAKVRQFSNLKEAAQHAVREFPKLIITDFHLNDVRSEAFVGLFETLFPRVPVLVTANDTEVIARLTAHHAEHFTSFSRTTTLPVLMDYLRQGLEAVGIPTVHTSSLPPKGLTQKQVQVLELIGAGYSNKDIASFLNISIETVKGHVKDILDRLNAKNRLEATLIYRHNALQNMQATELV